MTGKTKKPQVAAIGEIVSDILPDSRKLGGAPADFLHYAVKSGADGHLISAIGADDLGREVVAELNKFGIKPVLAITPYPTGRVLIFRSPSGGPYSGKCGVGLYSVYGSGRNLHQKRRCRLFRHSGSSKNLFPQYDFGLNRLCAGKSP